nr:putative toxin-antitoxin system toxin component, PIN family [Candidatus Freyarchaeota archaeon]
MKRVIIDTNVLFSGLFFKGNPNKILIHILQNMITSSEKVKLIFPEFIYQEILDILKRINAPEIMFLFVELIYEAESVIKIPTNKITEHLEKAKTILGEEKHKDIPIVAAVLSSNPDYLITGDKKLHKKLGRDLDNPESPPAKIGSTLVILPREATALLSQ